MAARHEIQLYKLSKVEKLGNKTQRKIPNLCNQFSTRKELPDVKEENTAKLWPINRFTIVKSWKT